MYGVPRPTSQAAKTFKAVASPTNDPESLTREPAGGLDRPPDVLRGGGHGEVADAQAGERVDDGVDDGGGRGRGCAFACGLDAERVRRREHFHDLGPERRQRVRSPRAPGRSLARPRRASGRGRSWG